MEALIRFYEDRITACAELRETLKKKIHRTGSLRLLLFACAVIALWLCRNTGAMGWGSVAVAFALPFIALMVYHNRLSGRKTCAEAMLRFNANERRGIDYDFSAFDGAPERTDAQHPFSTDLDVFGNQSLFQSVNRTVTHMGKSRLAGWFTQPLTNRADILHRREAVRELASKTPFRQHFYVTGIACEKNEKDMQLLEMLSGRATRFSQSRLWRLLVWLVPGVWLAIFSGVLWAGLPGGVPAVMAGVSFLVANMQAKRIHALHTSVDKMAQLLRTYSKLMEQVEKETFQSEMLKETQQLLVSQGTRASQAIRRLSGIIGALDQRFSTAGILLNLLYLRDVRQAMLLEQWLRTHAGSFAAWFESLAQTDALCSLGGFAFNHPDYIYPDIAGTYFQMEGKALGHPLLHREQCVRNDLCLTKSPYFLVVTGANMAGKSTYLRTVGVNFLLACVGMPVCAESLTLYPAHLATSLRTADSLAANESYFFAELKRLKMMIDRLSAGEELFIILDEILKGTNSKDKQKGSLALVKQLISKKTCGIIATHDLLLGTLEQEFPDAIRNYRFEADIVNDELVFTYRLREGIAQNMNASFLMKKMGITL
ncbi:MAG: DNA mismatch repair protein MutS [Tannerella sp.]|jgi:hypothetical protein|nr:DNA mismatch repair protein MutS [Tannerella sp.]